MKTVFRALNWTSAWFPRHYKAKAKEREEVERNREIKFPKDAMDESERQWTCMQ